MKGLIFRHVEYGVKHASSWPIKIRVCTVCVPKKQSNWDYRVFHILGRLSMGFTANLCSLLSSISTKCAQSCPIVRTYVRTYESCHILHTLNFSWLEVIWHTPWKLASSTMRKLDFGSGCAETVAAVAAELPVHSGDYEGPQIVWTHLVWSSNF